MPTYAREMPPVGPRGGYRGGHRGGHRGHHRGGHHHHRGGHHHPRGGHLHHRGGHHHHRGRGGHMGGHRRHLPGGVWIHSARDFKISRNGKLVAELQDNNGEWHERRIDFNPGDEFENEDGHFRITRRGGP